MEIRPQRRRGRPPKQNAGYGETREALLGVGVELLTEQGFSSTGIDEILRRLGVPKGSFYHYFDSKESFGRELIARYGAYFARKLDRFLLDEDLSPLDRFRAFVNEAKAGMQRYDYRRGCLIGNLGQEMGVLPESFRELLGDVFADWHARLVLCLKAAQAAGEIPGTADCEQLAAVFWISWEGAVLRAKLERSPRALEVFADFYFASIVA